MDAYVFIDSLPAEIVVTVPILDTTNMMDSNVTEVNDLRDIAIFIEALSDIGKALIDTVASLSVNLVTNVESFETVARFIYNIDEKVSVTAWVNKGNISLLDEKPRWIEGLWSSQKDVEGGTILGARMLLNDLPQSVDLNYTSVGDDIELNLNLEDFNYGGDTDYLIFSEKGIIGPKVTVFIENIPEKLDLGLDADIKLNATVENLTLIGNINLTTSETVGPIYLILDEEEDENPYHVELMISNLPSDMDLIIDFHDELLDFNVSSDKAIDYVALEIELGNIANLKSEWIEGISLDKSDDGGMSMKAWIEGGSPNIGVKVWDPQEGGARVDISLDEFNNAASPMDKLLLDVNNFANKSVLLRIDKLPKNFDLNASISLEDSEDENTTVVGNVTIESNKPLGSVYALIDEKTTESRLELAVPDVPEVINLDVDLGRDINVDFSSSSAPSEIIMSLDSGDVSSMDTDWTHGIVLKQTENGDSLKLYLEGTVTEANLSTEFGEPDKINLKLGDWSPETPWIYLDLDRGVNDTAIELFLDNVSKNNNVDAFFQTGKSQARDMDAIFDIHQTSGIGRAYLRTQNQTGSIINEAYFSEVPKDLKANVIVGKEIDIIYQADKPIEYILVKSANREYNKWRAAQAIVHDVPESFHMGINPHYEFDMDKSFVFQGFPDLFVETSSSEIDVLLKVDEGYTGGHSGTIIDVVNVGDNTTMKLDDTNYIIDSPEGIEKAYLQATNSPATPQFYLDYMVINARNVRHVEIVPNQIFGIYPIFELVNCHGDELSFAIGGDILLGPVKLKTSAVLIDVRIKSIGGMDILPSWLGVQKNGMDTELGDNEKHYILPEPGTSFIASLGATI